MRKRVGDTLIEVTLAIGIFSMVAIAVVAVMNGGTSSSQTALETTLAREEIDTQAEALRFIQSGYIADKDADNSETTSFERIWSNINSRAISPSQTADYSTFNSIISNTSSCNVAYDDKNFFANHAFVIDPNTMDLVLPSKDNNLAPFSSASTYPRLIKANQVSGSNTLSDQLADNSLTSDLARVEGLYVLAVKDNDTTAITSGDNTKTEQASAYIDFYIRACWYGAGEDASSNISTVVRLYNPDTTAVASKATGVWVEYKPNGGTGTVESVFVPAGGSTALSRNNGTNEFTYDGYKFVGWSTNPQSTASQVNSGVAGTYKPGATFTVRDIIAFNDKVTLYAIWQTEYFLAYNTNYASWSIGNTDCDKNNGCDISSSSAPSRSGLKFRGWCTKAISNNKCSGTLYQPGAHYPGVMSNKVIQLYALWVPWYQVLYYNTNGTTQLCIQDGELSSFTVKCNKTPTNPGHGEEFQGWSPNDREPFYVNGNNVTVANTGARTLKLYPVWRVSVNFSSEGWVPSSTGNSERSCYIFNYAKPTETNCPSRTCRYSEVKAGASYGDYTNKAPADGYKVINGGNHIEVLDEGIINLQGYCSRSANESVSYTIGKNDTFELSANMNTAGIRTHPSGYASISIGPITATIEDKRITSKCNSSAGGSYNYTNGNVINLKIEKHGNDYSISANGTVLKSCNVNTTGNVTVEYSMVHNSHNCDKLFNVQLVDIKMRRYIKN